MRLEEFVKDPKKVAALKRGVSRMKARNPSDPTSWFYQGAIHAVGPEAVQEALARDPNVAQVDQMRFWNQCPHSSNQNSAEFLLWHRAYVYYFERVLREASGDPNFSLPYWNYTDASQRGFPQLFANADPDPVTQQVRNPLFDHRREQAFMFGLYELSDQVVGTSTIFGETEFFGPTEDTGFAGGVADNNGRTRGRVERQPHDLVHFAIGGAIGSGEVDTGDANIGMMSSVATAAFDPIFWVHHVNIDRLWAVWDCLSSPARTWGKVPASEWLDARPWFFNDLGGSVVNHPRKFYLDRRNFDVAYDSDSPTCQPLSATDPEKAVQPPVVAAMAPLAVGGDIKSFVVKAEAGLVSTKGRIAPDVPHTVTIPLKTLPAALGSSAKSALMTSSIAAPRRIILEIQDISVEGVTSVGFDVFVNVPEGIAPTRESRNYIGTISLFGASETRGHTHPGGSPSVQRFDVSKVVALGVFDPGKFKVQIVPFDLLTPRAGRSRIRRAVGVTYGAMRVLVLEGSNAPLQ